MDCLEAQALGCRVRAWPQAPKSLLESTGVNEDLLTAVKQGDEAKARALMNPAGTITSVKRFMGRGLEDIDDMNDLDINDSTGLPTRTDRARD